MAGAIAQGFHEELTVASGTPTATTGSITTSASGSTFICAISGYSPPVTAVTDNKGNTYTALATSITNGGSGLIAFICVNGAGGSGHKPSITQGAGDLIAVSFFEITGAATASAQDGTTGAGLDSSSPFNATTTTSNANDLIVTIGATNGAAGTVTYTPGAGFTLDTNSTHTSGTNGISIGVMSQHVTATGTYGGNFTASSGTAAGVITFALKDLGGGGGGGGPLINGNLVNGLLLGSLAK